MEDLVEVLEVGLFGHLFGDCEEAVFELGDYSEALDDVVF